MVTSLNSRVASGVSTLFSRPKNTSAFGLNALGRTPGLPALALDFTNGNQLDPRITFSRASSASYFDRDGYLKLASSGAPRFDHDPVTGVCKGLLIEESRTNLLTYSEQFDNAAWNQSNATVTANATTAPDGTLTADKFETTGGGASYLYQGNTLTQGQTYTLSAYVKLISGNIVWLRDFTEAGVAKFDISVGIVSEVTGIAANASITSCGNGWYRISAVFTPTIATGNHNLSCAHPSSSLVGNAFYVWGAQLEAGAFPTSYIPSADSFTSRASTATYIGSNGLIQSASTNVARYNYNPLNLTLAPKLLLEAAATNLLTYSEQFDNAAWMKTRSSITANATTAPDGTTTADKLVEDTTASNAHYIYTFQSKAGSANTYANSIYVKAAERTQIRFSTNSTAGGSYALFDLLAGTASATTNTGSFTASSAYMTPVGNGWYRCTIVCTTDTDTRVETFLAIANSGSVYYTGDGTSGIYIWGAQLEAGAFPTSYIPTTTAQATRAADISSSAQATRAADLASITGSNFSSWYNQTEGTLFAEADSISAVVNCGIVSPNDGTANNRLQLFCETNAAVSWYATAGGVNTLWSSGGSRIANTPFKVAGAYATNNAAISFNGASAVTDSSVAIPAVSQLSIGSLYSGGSLNGHIKRLAYYQKRLANTELQALTA